jgi:glycosyltransferase involved in cell wall biosynthesis
MVLSHDLYKPGYLDIRVFYEARSLVKSGFEVFVVCFVSSEAEFKSQEKYKSVNIVRVPIDMSRQSKARRILGRSKKKNMIASKIAELDPDIIHCHDLDTLSEGAAAAKNSKVPLIYDAHEDWPVLEYSKGSKMMYLATSLLEKILVNNVAHIITVNKILEEKYSKYGKTTVLYNYPHLDFLKTRIKPAEFRKKYGLAKKTVIMYHGLIGKRKGIEELIEVAVILAGKHKDLKFLVAGPGYEPFVEVIKSRGLEESFIFTGRVDHENISALLECADIYYSILQPTKQYVTSTPIKIFEAMYMGLPIIANEEFPEVVEILGKTKAGILVKCDVNEIVNAMELLIKDPEERVKLGEKAKKIAEKSYIWETQEAKLVGLYKDLLTNNSSISK